MFGSFISFYTYVYNYMVCMHTKIGIFTSTPNYLLLIINNLIIIYVITVQRKMVAGKTLANQPFRSFDEETLANLN